MELERIAVRTFLAYIYILAMMRFTGNRSVSQGHVFDFIVLLILGDMLDDLIWGEIPASQFVVGTGTILLLHGIITLLTYHLPAARSLLEGEEVMFMKDGRPLKRTQRRERLNIKVVEELLRVDGVTRENWKEVKSAWINTSGRPGVVKHEWARPATRGDLERVKEAKR